MHRRGPLGLVDAPVGYHYFAAGTVKLNVARCEPRQYPITVIRELRIVSCGNGECLYQPVRQHERCFNRTALSPSCFTVPRPLFVAPRPSNATFLLILYRSGFARPPIDNQRVFAKQIAVFSGSVASPAIFESGYSSRPVVANGRNENHPANGRSERRVRGTPGEHFIYTHKLLYFKPGLIEADRNLPSLVKFPSNQRKRRSTFAVRLQRGMRLARSSQWKIPAKKRGLSVSVKA